MATYRQNLITRLENIAAELAAMDATQMGGKANVKARDGGTTIDHVGYRKSLLDEQKQLLDALARANETEAAINGDDPYGFEFTTYVDL